MDLLTKINKILLVIITITVFFFLVGIAYAYFTADITGAEIDKTITMNSGEMDIVFNGGDGITASKIEPSYEPFASKEFTVAGTSAITTAVMRYEITLIIDENTFTEGAISYTLTSTNTANNGSIVNSILDRTGIGTNDIVLGNGKFLGETNSATHTYVLDVYFYETGENQFEDMNKTFKAHVGIENYLDPCLTENCLNNHIISLADNSLETGVYDENGYRYEGIDPNNYVTFNNETWRIIGVFDDYTHGITGENLVKLIKADSIGNYAWDSGSVNNWNTSSLKTYLNGDYYTSINQASKSLIENVTWKLGGLEEFDSPVSIFYVAERGTTVYSGNPTTEKGYVGLMYPSDYAYASLSSTCARTTNLSAYNKPGCYNQNWLYLGTSEWTITPHSGYSDSAFLVFSVGIGYDSNTFYSAGVRPSLYLKSSTTIIDGNGTADNPYVLGEY
ncbi:MAG: DUF6273 domain-containing protein [Bacilli bacterium]|nr:DUF6273 domain-containing protein [Bacilli bacterium]